MSGNHVNRRTVLGAVGTTIVGGMIATGSAAAEGHAETFSAELTGDAEVPPVETNASGRTTFEVAEDGSAVHFEVFIDCIQNVTQGHIHLGDEGENGPVVVWLYPQDTREPELIEGVQRDFVLAEGTLTDEDLVDELEGESLEALIEAMREEGAYVNIHSEQNPAGEIRGQIVPDEEAEVADTEEPEEPPEDVEDDEEVDDDDEEEEEEPPEEDEEDPDDEEDELDEEDEDEDEPDDPEDEEEDDDDEETETITQEVSLEVVDKTVDQEGQQTEDEFITFQNTGDEGLDMTGFVVTDREEGGTGSVYEFGDFTLGSGEQVTLVTGEGTDTDDTVYWGLGAPRWNRDGDIIVVLDASGEEVLEYAYGDQTALGFVFSVIRSVFA
jgi:hypothetical protein